MSKIIKDDKHIGIYYFYCPACKCEHCIATNENKVGFHAWKWNGDMENPTISPSVCTTESYRGKESSRCHLFVRDGKIQYLSDCSHDMAGKTVDMIDFDDLNKEEI